MTTENAATTETSAAIAEQGATVAPGKASSKKGASPKKGAPKGKTSAEGGKPKKTAPAKKAAKPAKAKKAAKAEASAGPREGSKTARLIEMLKRPDGATLDAIMAKFGWQAHTTRALMSAGGSLKKAGLTVESFKSEKGERTYRINQ